MTSIPAIPIDPTVVEAVEAMSGPTTTDAAIDPQALRIIEAVLFASAEPVDARALAARLPEGTDVDAAIAVLEAHYAGRGVNLVRVAGRFALRTAPDLAGVLKLETVVGRKLSRAAVETLAIIAYHQPITRTEVEEIRGVALSRGTLDTLMEAGWIKPKGHRETPGRPATWVTTEVFLSHFGLDSLDDLPGVEDLRAAGLLDARPAISAYRETAEDSGADEAAPDEASAPSEAAAEIGLEDHEPHRQAG
jgi:segregation and condensation protein B